MGLTIDAMTIYGFDRRTAEIIFHLPEGDLTIAEMSFTRVK